MRNSCVTWRLLALLCASLFVLAACGGSGSSKGGDGQDYSVEQPTDDPNTSDPDPEPDQPQPEEPDPEQETPEPVLPEILYIDTSQGRMGPGRILDPTVRFIGHSNPYDTIILSVSNVGSGSVQANSEGVWNLDFRPFSLLPGSYRAEVTAITLDGESLESDSPFLFTYDPSPPGRPQITAISDDSGMAGDGITNVADQAVLGRSEPGYGIRVFVNGELAGTTMTDSAGQWRFDLSGTVGALAQGQYELRASSVDFGLESTLSEPLIVVVDQQAPQPSQLLPRAGSVSVAQAPRLQIQFAEPVLVNGGQVLLRRAADGQLVRAISLADGAVSGNGSSQIDIPVASLLAFSTQYYVELEAGAFQDLAGNLSPAISGQQQWFFTVEQPAFPPINIADLSGDQGFLLSGLAALQLGADVAGVGDMNGDGWDEFAVGAPDQDGQRGTVYLLFGRAGLNRNNISVESWSSGQGIMLRGAAPGDRLGAAVSAAGDLNGDGLGDLVVSAPGSDLGGEDAGSVYVLWGRSQLADLDLAAWSVADGFRVLGREPGQALGGSATASDAIPGNGQVLAAGGDFNGDGFDDLLLGQPGSDSETTDGGAAFVILGRAGGVRSDVDTALLGADGFAVRPGAGASGRLGQSVAFAHDFNADGLDDIALGASGADLGAVQGGAVFLVYGIAGTNFSDLDLNTFNASQGVRWVASESGALLGSALAAGEFNGDGIADLYMGQPGKDHDGIEDAGAVTVVFGGRNQPFSSDVELLDASQGFTVYGESPNDQVGQAVACAGDINADGLDDLVAGAYNGLYGGQRSGRAWVILGSDDDAINSWNLADFLASDGVPLRGAMNGDRLGQSLSAADHNGDGFSDVILGAPGNSSDTGLAAILWGSDWLGDVVFLNGLGGADNIVGSSANDVLVGNGGLDAYSAGSGDDRIESPDAGFFRVQGGNGVDTLAITGSNVTLDLGAIAPEVINSIEVIDLGDSNNQLQISRQRVLGLSPQTNTLRVTGGSSDRFATSAADNWNRVGDVQLGGITYVHYADGEAEVLVQNSIIQPGVERLLSSQRYYLDTTENGAAVNGNVTNFPLLLRIDDPAIIDAVQPGAPDIRFVDADGTTRLPYEIERWDQAGNEALVWVLVPQVDGNSDRDFITLLYDDAVDGSVADGQNPATLWNDYTGVWHFGETGSAQDSSPFGNNGIDRNGVGRTESFIGRGATFTNDDAYQVPYSESMDFSGGAFAVETWYNSDTCSTSLLGRLSLSLLGRGDGSTGYWELDSAQYVASIIVIVGSRVDRASFTLGQGGQSETLSGGSLIGVFLGDCVEHVIASYDPLLGSSIYINGVLRATDSTRYNVDSTADLFLGGHGTRYDLTLDESRLARRSWNADRVNLTYQNQVADSALVSPE